MRGDEARVVDSFCEWLEREGWDTSREVDGADVVASRATERLIAEAKGRTESLGLDVDTLYGQLLRRMPSEDDPGLRFAVVVPEEGVNSARRVVDRVRDLLKIDIFAVSESGDVRRIAA